MTTGGRPRRLTRRTLCKQLVRISARGLEPTPGRGRLHGQVALDTIFRDVLTGQRTSDLTKVDGNGESLETPKTQATPDPETPDPETPDEPTAAAEPEAGAEGGAEAPAEPEAGAEGGAEAPAEPEAGAE